MAIRLDMLLFAKIHERQQRKVEQDFVNRFTELGQKAADELIEGVDKAAPRVRKAMHRAADATIDYGRKLQAASKANREFAETSEQVERSQQNLGTLYARNKQLANDLERQEGKLDDARKSAQRQARAIATREENLRKKRAEHAETAEKLRLKELDLKQIRLDHGSRSKKALEFEKRLMPLRRQNAREIGWIARKESELKEAKAELDKRNAAVRAIEEDIDLLRKEQKATVTDLTNEEQKLIKTRERQTALDQEVKRLNEEVTRSNRRREESIRSLAEAERDEIRRAEEAARKRAKDKDKAKGLGVVGNMLTDLPFVPSGRAGAWIGGGMLMVMASAMEGLVTASQSVATLPAILAAAGAGIGTLALGLQGFGDTIKEIGDPEKFAEAIQSLSPAAQQAALEIQYLVQGPLQELKNITQETLFAGVAEELHNFTNQYLPQVQHMTTGIAGAFNDMFSNALNQLMTPDTADSMAVLMNNIVKFFQNMAPAVGPFVDAFVKLTETGSKFLPGFGKSITEMAENFNKFITQAQRDGTLENFMKKGLEAAKAVGDVIWDIGKRLYETFGNKGPEDFKQMLDDIVSAAFGLIDAITGVSRALNDVLKIVQPIVDLMGGWEDVVKRILELWVGWNAVKFTGLLTGLNTVSDTLGVVGPGGKGGKGILGKLATAVGLMGLMDQTFTQGSGNVFGGMAQGAMNGAMAGAIFGWPGAAVGAAAGTVYGAGDAIIDAEAKKRREQEARDREFRSNMGILEAQGYKPNNPLDPKSFAGQASDNKPTPGRVDANKDAIGNILDIVTTPTGQHGPPPDAGLPPWAERPVPAPPVDDSGSKRDKLNEYLSNLNPTDFMPTMPTGGMPMMAVPAAGGVPMMTPPMAAPAVGPGPMGVNPGIAQLAQIAKQFGLELTSGKTGREGETGSHHSTGNAGDFSNGSAPTPQMRAFAEYVAQNFAPFIKELIYTDDQGGVNLYNGKPHTYSAGTQAQHRNHVHVALTEQAAMGALTPMPPLQYGTGGQPYAQPGWGYYDVDPVGVMKAQHRLEREAHDVALARMELQAKRDLGYTLHEIREAENKVKEEEIQWMEAYQDLIEAQQGTWKKVNESRSGGGMGTLGPGIDADFGLSKGLGGLAENLIKFVGSLAMSPILAALNQFTKGESDGYGLMGILGAQWFNQSVDMPYGPGGVPNFAMTTNLPQFTSFGPPGSKQAIANMIYQMARQRGYSAHEAQSIVAYAIGESGLDPTISGGVQGDDEVIGLFQQKSAFARANGIDPSQRSDPYANTWAYLNALDKTRAQNPGMSIEQLLPKTSAGGPLASGPGAQPQAWGPLMAQAAQLLNMPAGAAPTPTSSPWVPTSATGSGPGWFGLPSLSNVPSMGGSVLPGSGMPQSPAFTGGGAGGGGTVSPSYTLGGAAGGTSFTTPTPTDHAPGEGGWQPAGGGTLGIGGIPMAALGSATSAGGLAVDAMAPGAGQVAAAAAQTGVQLANRAIGYAGQLGAVAVNGLLETFGLSDSVIGDPQKSWIGRVATGLASARPALPNVAGQSKPPAPPPQQQQDPNYQNHSGSGQPPGPTVNIESFVQAPNRNSQQTVQDLAFAMYANR